MFVECSVAFLEFNAVQWGLLEVKKIFIIVFQQLIYIMKTTLLL